MMLSEAQMFFGELESINSLAIKLVENIPSSQRKDEWPNGYAEM